MTLEGIQKCRPQLHEKATCRILTRLHKVGCTDGKALNGVTVTNNKPFSVIPQNLISVIVWKIHILNSNKIRICRNCQKQMEKIVRNGYRQDTLLVDAK